MDRYYPEKTAMARRMQPRVIHFCAKPALDSALDWTVDAAVSSANPQTSVERLVYKNPSQAGLGKLLPMNLASRHCVLILILQIGRPS